MDNGTETHSGSYFEEKWRYFVYDIWEPVDIRLKLFSSLSGGPWHIIGLTLCYLYFAWVAGPWLMRNRPPYRLNRILLGYNLFMVFINGYIFYRTSSLTRFSIETWGCRPFGSHSITNNAVVMDCFVVGWLFHLSKYIDWLDTVFFVLQKKAGHLSALHVLHHALMPLMSWAGLMYVANLKVGFIPWINSFIHTVMYSYYALSTLGPRVRPFLWWKKYLTQLQMVQLIMISAHVFHFYFLPGCSLYSISFRALVISFASTNLYMFYTFFKRSYPCIRIDVGARKNK